MVRLRSDRNRSSPPRAAQPAARPVQQCSSSCLLRTGGRWCVAKNPYMHHRRSAIARRALLPQDEESCAQPFIVLVAKQASAKQKKAKQNKFISRKRNLAALLARYRPKLSALLFGGWCGLAFWWLVRGALFFLACWGLLSLVVYPSSVRRWLVRLVRSYLQPRALSSVGK